METLDLIIYAFGAVLLAVFVYIIISYVKGLKGAPRELYIVCSTSVLEYTAYGAMAMSFVLFLSSKGLDLSDKNASWFIVAWGLVISVVTMVVGSIADTFGVKRTLLMGTTILLFGRFVIPFTENLYILAIFSFLPMGIGLALKGPVLTVAIKKLTTPETSALGFGLFYTLMNVGYALGAWIFDKVRHEIGRDGDYNMLGLMDMSAYQVIFLIALICTIFNFIMIYMMRNGAELNDETGELQFEKFDDLQEGNKAVAIYKLVKDAGVDAIALMKKVFVEKAFWIFMGMLSSLIFVRLTFYHFHYTFPKYGDRVLNEGVVNAAEGVNVGAIFGVLNPMIIIFLTPLIATLTKQFKSFNVLLIGTFISSIAILIAVIPDQYFLSMSQGWVGELILHKWLDVPDGAREPLIVSLVIMVIIFTVGEAIWSPRLMQFTAEIAPKGKEGSYIALSMLPSFLAKFAVGYMSAELLVNYAPEGASHYPLHYMVWVWIGGMALISPILLFIFKRAFTRNE